MNTHETEAFKTDLTFWEIGPYHGSLPGPILLRLKLDGEIIVRAELESGFLHRGLEKIFENHDWKAAIAYADHLDPEGAAFGELALCLAVEEIAGIAVAPRAQVIRVILSELSRMSTHLVFAARVARAVGAETMVHYVLRDRERILDLFELLTGARFSLNFLRFGGVKADVTEGFIERVLEVCEMIRGRLKEYNDLLTFNHSFLKRTAGVGEISGDMVRRLGITGPNARAAGVAFDVRKKYPYCGYDKLDFEIPLGDSESQNTGDAHDRFVLRLREIAQSVEILKQIAESVPLGEFQAAPAERLVTVPSGEAYSRVESSRGLLGCHVVSNGKAHPSRVQFRVATHASLEAVPQVISGIRIEDLPVVLASLDLCVSEADR